MATGENSFHWLDCEFCPEEMKKQYQKFYAQYKNQTKRIKFYKKIENEVKK